VKKIEVNILVPKEVVEYLKAKFKTKEEAEAFVVSVIRKEMEIDLPPHTPDTLKYQRYRRKVKELHDAGKEISAEALAQLMGASLGISSARDWLRHMEKDKWIALDRKGIGGKRIYRWLGKIEQ
jgi:hypothetical protein